MIAVRAASTPYVSRIFHMSFEYTLLTSTRCWNSHTVGKFTPSVWRVYPGSFSPFSITIHLLIALMAFTSVSSAAFSASSTSNSFGVEGGNSNSTRILLFFASYNMRRKNFSFITLNGTSSTVKPSGIFSEEVSVPMVCLASFLSFSSSIASSSRSCPSSFSSSISFPFVSPSLSSPSYSIRAFLTFLASAPSTSPNSSSASASSSLSTVPRTCFSSAFFSFTPRMLLRSLPPITRSTSNPKLDERNAFRISFEIKDPKAGINTFLSTSNTSSIFRL